MKKAHEDNLTVMLKNEVKRRFKIDFLIEVDTCDTKGIGYFLTVENLEFPTSMYKELIEFFNNENYFKQLTFTNLEDEYLDFYFNADCFEIEKFFNELKLIEVKLFESFKKIHVYFKLKNSI